MFTDSIRTDNTACAWLVRHDSTSSLQVSRHHQVAIRLQRLVGIRIVHRPTANSSIIRRGVRRDFCSPDLPCIEELVSDMDDKLFNCILSDKRHVLYQLLPPEHHCGYTLRPRKHELCLINKSRLDEQNFMYRLLFKDMY